LLTDSLVERLSEGDITFVECGDVDRPVETAVLDACEHCDVPTDAGTTDRRLAGLRSYLLTLAGIAPFLFDQLFSVLIGLLQVGRERADVLFVPSVGRFDSLEPILEAAEYDFEVVLPATSIAWFWKLRSSRPDLRRYSPLTLNMYMDTNVFGAEMRYLLRDLPQELITERRLEKEVRELLNSEYGVDMGHTVGAVVQDILSPQMIRSMFAYYLIQRGVDGPDTTVVTPGLSPLGRSLIAGAAEVGCRRYDVPHSMTSSYSGPMPPDTVGFVEGELAMRYFRKQPFVPEPSGYRPFGRPYFAELRSEIRQRKRDGVGPEAADDVLDVVVATQPFEDSRRSTFAETVLGALSGSEIPVDVTLKPHPDEDTSFYEPIVDRAAVDATIRTGDILDILLEADVVVNVNSNVGFEAILAEATCICVNLWEPLTWSMPYAEEGPIPILRNPTELTETFASLTTESVAEMQRQQLTFAQENVVLSRSCAADIAAAIRGGS
jgi:hypothetical protein